MSESLTYIHGRTCASVHTGSYVCNLTVGNTHFVIYLIDNFALDIREEG